MQQFGELFDHRKILRFTEPTPASDHHVGLVKFRATGLFDMNCGHFGCASGTSIRHCNCNNLCCTAAALLRCETFWTERCKVWARAGESGGEQHVATKDRRGGNHFAADYGNVHAVGQHGHTQLHRQARDGVTPVVVLRKQNEIRLVTAANQCRHGTGSSNASKSTTEVAGGVHLLGAELAE